LGNSLLNQVIVRRSSIHYYHRHYSPFFCPFSPLSLLLLLLLLCYCDGGGRRGVIWRVERYPWKD